MTRPTPPALRLRRDMLRGALALPLLAAAGCVAIPYGPYYRPAAGPGARLRRAWCQGQAGPETIVEIDAGHGVQVVASAHRDDLRRDDRGQPGLPLRVQLTLPAGVPARFLEAGATLRETGSGRTLDAPLAVRVIASARVAADAWVEPLRLRPAGAAGRARDPQRGHGQLRASFEALRGFAPPAMTLQLPAVQLGGAGGETVTTPPLLLRRPGSEQRPGDYRSEAEQQHLREREAACRRDTPQLACRNIVPYGERSFALAAGPLQWSGRWWRFETPARAEPLRGDVELAVQDPRPWRLADPAVLLADAGGSKGLRLPFPALDLLFDDDIALATPLQAVPGGRPPRLLLEATLPDGLPGFELRLPLLQVGAERVELAPLRFERRVFDGGVEPLNC
ncbi:MAG: hypothetical protein KF683_25955 [Rubrivivax sp.]|nr:hypothetical protein [Rubrivivax sp.]